MKNLFSESLSKKKLVIISASFIVFVAVLGGIFFEYSKNKVVLTLDGQEKIIRTHAATIKDLLIEQDISLRSEDYVFPSEDTKIENHLEIVWKPAKQVQVVEGHEKKTIWTTAHTIQELLKEENISLAEHDKVKPKLKTKIKDGLIIEVDKAFLLTLVNGEKKQQVWSTSTTVADFLLQQEIELTKFDRVEPELDATIREKTVVNVIRVEKVTDVVEEPVNFAVVTRKDSTLAKGDEKTVTSGHKGLVKKEYEVVLENGKEVSRKLLKETYLKDKRDKVVAVGARTGSQTVSRGVDNGSKEFYVTATAYTAYCNGCSGTTATGLNLRSNPNIKVIAVDPKVIPLGTKVYVEGYGYAIASDTGSAIKGHKIDVFYSSQSEAFKWGRKTVRIKILD